MPKCLEFRRVLFRSLRRSATTPRRRLDKRSAHGGSTAAVTSPSRTLHACSTPSCKGGSTIMGASTSPCCSSFSGASTSTSFVGPCGNTSGCVVISPERWSGWRTSLDVILASLLTGGWVCDPTAGQWEPGERRRSRRVLREPGGEIPPGHSPRCPLRHRGEGARSASGTRRAARVFGPRAAPRQDEDRVLQGADSEPFRTPVPIESVHRFRRFRTPVEETLLAAGARKALLGRLLGQRGSALRPAAP